MTAAITQSEMPQTRIGSGVGIKLGYSIGNLGKSIVWTSFDTFLLYYLVRIAGFAPLVAGGLLTAVMLWDGCADIAVAYLADRHGQRNALGRLILLGAPLCGVSFWLIFALSPGDWHHVILVAVILCRIGYTLCDIGHNTMLVRIATTGRDAATVSGMRLIFSAVGAGLVGLAAAALPSADSGHRRADFAVAAMIGGAIYVVTLMIATHATRHLPTARTGPSHSDATTIFGFGALWRNRMYRSVLCLIAVQAGLIPLFSRGLPFVGEATHGSAGWAGTALTVITLSQALSLPAWMALTRWWSSNAVLALAYGAMMVALGLLAAQSGGAIGIVGLSLLGIAQAGMNMAIWAMLALSVRYGGTDGAGNEALPVGLFLAVLKGSAGIGNGLLAVSVAIGNQWCFGHDAGPTIFAATILPMSGCVAGLLLVLWTSRIISLGAEPAV